MTCNEVESLSSWSGPWREVERTTNGASPTLDAVDLYAKVLIVSDSVDRGEREDLAGPLISARLEEAGFSIAEYRAVPDGEESVAASLREMSSGFPWTPRHLGRDGVFAPRPHARGNGTRPRTRGARTQ
jgi:hypothetical protein